MRDVWNKVREGCTDGGGDFRAGIWGRRGVGCVETSRGGFGGFEGMEGGMKGAGWA